MKNRAILGVLLFVFTVAGFLLIRSSDSGSSVIVENEVLDNNRPQLSELSLTERTESAPPPFYSDRRSYLKQAGDLKLRKWISVFKMANAAKQAELLEEGIKLAEVRRVWLKDQIQNNPEAAFAFAISRADREGLPEEILRLLSKPVSARAELAVMQSCFHGLGDAVPVEHKHEVYRTTVIDNQEYRVSVFGSRLNDGSLKETSLVGFAVDEYLVVDDSRFRLVDRGEPLPSDLDYSPGDVVVDVNGEILVFESYDQLDSFAQELREAEKNPVVNEADSGQGSSGVSGRPSQAWTHGDKSLLVIRVDFSDLVGVPINKFDSDAPITPAYLDNVINGGGEVAQFIEDSSFGKSRIVFDSNADVTDVLRMPNTAESYAIADATTLLHTHARAAALAEGFDSNDYDRVAVVFTFLGDISGSQIDFGGLANVIGPNIWVNGSFDFRVVAHEFGHTYGLRHSNLWQVSGSDPVDLTGFSSEYGDPFDLMGDGDFIENDFSHWNKSILQWIPDSAVYSGDLAGTYRIHRLDGDSADLGLARALKISRDSTRDYWIGYRRGLSSTATDNGAYVIWGYDSLQQGDLLDLVTPGSNANDAPLPVGSSFDDSASGITLTSVTQGGSGADEWLDVTVAFQPRLQWSLANYVVNEQGGTAELTVNRLSNSSGAVSVNFSTVDGSATSGTDFTASSGTLQWADQDSAPKIVTITIQPDAMVEGTETFTVQLSSPVGGVVVDPNVATVTIADPGASDPEFFANFINNSVYAVAPDPDGKIVIGGFFSQLQDQSFVIYDRSRIARMNSDGTIDLDFDPGGGANDLVRKIIRQPDGKYLLSGDFTEYDGVSRDGIARIHTDGSLDTSFSGPGSINGQLRTMLLLPNEKILIGGFFTSVDGIDREYLAQLNADGSLDMDYTGPNFGSSSGFGVESLVAIENGQVLVGGAFFFSGSPFRAGLCRIDSDGQRDTSFSGITNGAHAAGNTSLLASITDISVFPDGDMIIIGNFSAYNNTARDGVARLTSNGALVSGFNPSVNDTIRALLTLPDGGTLIGGDFTQVDGQSATRIARLTESGVLDTAFAAAGGHSSDIIDFALQDDGNVLFGAGFGNFQGSASGRPLWRLVPGLPGLPGIIDFEVNATSATEGTTQTITVSRSGGALGEVTVGYSSVDETASAGTDYTDTGGVLMWADGESSPKVISLPVTADGVADTPETLHLNIGVPLVGAVLGEVQQVTITLETAFGLWQESNFTVAELSDPLISGDDADPDKDGYNNLAEFAFGSDPQIAGDTNSPVVSVQNTDGADYLTISFHRRVPALDLNYVVESDGDLDDSWSGLPVMVGSPVDNLDGTETVVFRDSVPVDSVNDPQRFIRVRVTRTE